ncbi:hypothetical protein EB241_05925 [Erwinia psidii]|uniref:Uncharacterized protein n=1 Tax=Erwinia psidii TaxID=69224 RepID=A0A3N6SNF6_9GAMM|nr:hypothetical protein EB241_05925 [Erwinia psidii]
MNFVNIPGYSGARRVSFAYLFFVSPERVSCHSNLQKELFYDKIAKLKANKYQYIKTDVGFMLLMPGLSEFDALINLISFLKVIKFLSCF